MGHGSVAQAIIQTQCNDADTTQDWDLEVLNHVLVQVLDKDQLGTNATDKFTVFVHREDFNDMHLLLTMTEDSFKSMGCVIDFKMFWSLQGLSKMCNQQVLDTMCEGDENTWFLGLSK